MWWIKSLSGVTVSFIKLSKVLVRLLWVYTSFMSKQETFQRRFLFLFLWFDVQSEKICQMTKLLF